MEAETLKVIAAAGPKNSGGAAVKKPDYFEEVCDIVKDKAKSCPKNLLDSLGGPSITSDKKSLSSNDDKSARGPSETMLDEEEEDEKVRELTPVSPFLKVQATSNPKKGVNNNDILEFLKADAAKRDQQTNAMLDFFRKKAKKEDRRQRSFLSVLKDITGKKRKTETSSDTSSESDDDGK